jgi:hypothetical protein
MGGREEKAKEAIEPQEITEEADVAGKTTMTIIPVALLVLFVGSILSGFIFRGSLTFFPALLQREIYFITSHDEPVVIAGFVTTAILSLGLIGSWLGGYLNDKTKMPELFPVVIFIIVAKRLPRAWDSGLISS